MIPVFLQYQKNSVSNDVCLQEQLCPVCELSNKKNKKNVSVMNSYEFSMTFPVICDWLPDKDLQNSFKLRLNW